MSRCSFTFTGQLVYTYFSCIYVSVSLYMYICLCVFTLPRMFSIGRCTIYAVLQRLANVKEETLANEEVSD